MNTDENVEWQNTSEDSEYSDTDRDEVIFERNSHSCSHKKANQNHVSTFLKILFSL